MQGWKPLEPHAEALPSQPGLVLRGRPVCPVVQVAPYSQRLLGFAPGGILSAPATSTPGTTAPLVAPALAPPLVRLLAAALAAALPSFGEGVGAMGRVGRGSVLWLGWGVACPATLAVQVLVLILRVSALVPGAVAVLCFHGGADFCVLEFVVLVPVTPEGFVETHCIIKAVRLTP